MRPQRVEKPSAKQTPPDARKVALAPEAKGGNTPSSTFKGQLLFSHSILL